MAGLPSVCEVVWTILLNRISSKVRKRPLIDALKVVMFWTVCVQITCHLLWGVGIIPTAGLLDASCILLISEMLAV